MSTIKLKVCGMRDKDNIRDVLRLQPDYMGFIFYARTPRYVGDDFLIPEDFPAATKRVGVFVNETTDAIRRKVAQHKLDFVQLHGDETVEECAALKDVGTGVIKVFSVGDDMDFRVTDAYRHVVDYFLFDTKGKFYGGNARAFDWSVLARYHHQIPFFLSGGITPDNAAGIRLLGQLPIQAIDVNSGVEVSPAIKDVMKISAVKAVLNSKILNQ